TMQSHTILRFGQGKGNSTKLAVELGAIKLQVQQAGSFGLDVGDIKLAPNGEIEIGPGTAKLVAGQAQITDDQGVHDLIVGNVFSIGKIVMNEPADAGVADAPPVDAEPD